MLTKDVTLINFTDLDASQNEMVLSWRNDEGVKKWMYTSHDISIDEHLKFIEFLKSSDLQIYFLVRKSDEDIGVINFKDFDKDKKSAYFGLYSNPSTKVLGVGRVLEEVSIEYATNILNLEVLKLEVYEDNKPVINLHKKYKFEKYDTKVINDKDVACMQLRL
jgi:UDP-4-amino-4,6-dideoxy-N-acetyl-beta-L-altrosamine N-acetyltransferase